MKNKSNNNHRLFNNDSVDCILNNNEISSVDDRFNN